MSAAVVVPAITVDPLVRRCVAECRRTAPEAEVVVLVDEAPEGTDLGPGVRLVVTGPVTIAAKRNLGTALAGTDHVAFIDSDAYPAEGWLHNAVARLDADPTLAVVGGPNVSPPEQSRSERHVGFAHESFLVGGWWAYRRDPRAHERLVHQLPSCNMVVRRSDYEALGGMAEHLFTAEDTDFCHRLVGAGRRILFTPDVLVFHKNRDLRHFAIQRYTFGAAMVPLLREGTSPEPAYVITSGLVSAFVLFLMSGPLGIRWRPWRRLWGGVVVAYAGVVGVEALRHARPRSDVPGTAVALVVGNLGPGVGQLMKLLGISPDLRGVYRNDRSSS